MNKLSLPLALSHLAFAWDSTMLLSHKTSAMFLPNQDNPIDFKTSNCPLIFFFSSDAYAIQELFHSPHA
jgi:hypothetical protein